MQSCHRQHDFRIAVLRVVVAFLGVSAAAAAMLINLLAWVSGGIASVVHDPTDYWLIVVALAIPASGIATAVFIFSRPKLAASIAGVGSIVTLLFFGASPTTALVIAPMVLAAIVGTALSLLR